MAQANPKVLWKEGLFLLPHHFQQWERYHENLLNFRVRQLLPFGWGVIDMEINRDGLANGNLTLETFRGIFPGGTAVNIPDVDDAPASRIVEPRHFDPSSNSLGLYLALPVERTNSANCHLLEDREGLNEKRYIQELVRVSDGNTGENSQEIAIAKKNLRILFAGESSDNYERLKIAELVRAADGSIALKRDYIPPCLVISASSRLVNILEGLVHALTAKSSAVSEQCQRQSPERYEFGATDLTTLWLLHTLNSFIPVLNHFYRIQRIHPEEVFRSFSQLAGELSVFAVKINAVNLPPYEHENLSSTFVALDRTIRELLNLVTPSQKCKRINLQEQQTRSDGGNPIFAVEVEEQWLEPTYRFYLALKVEDGNIIDRIPGMVKIASVNEIDLLIGRALRGINIIPVSPALLLPTIPQVPGYAYFRLESRKEDWESVRASKTLAVYIPDEFHGLLAELIAAEE